MTSTVDLPVVDETHARARLDALVAEHGLPEPTTVSWSTPDHFQPWLFVWANTADVVARWAHVLGVEPDVTSTVRDSDIRPGEWYVERTATVRDVLLPGVRLVVMWHEGRFAAHINGGAS